MWADLERGEILVWHPCDLLELLASASSENPASGQWFVCGSYEPGHSVRMTTLWGPEREYPRGAAPPQNSGRSGV